MLVLLSFGLVLLATILLVVGLLNDDGITLIYLSIAASATAAVVLYLAFRRARPTDEGASEAPAPLDEQEPEDLAAAIDQTGATAAPAPAAASPAAAPVPAPVPTPEPVPAATAADDEAWADDTDWEVDDLPFPIADYDELSVAEIMPLLPQLYSDELDVVHEREQSGKNRSTILARLEKLKETGTEADAEEQAAAAELSEDAAPGRTDVEIADDPTQVIDAPAPAPAAPAPSVSLLDEDEDEDDAAFFPIADYDDLSVSQIMPLLSQLELDELQDVKAREQSGANRKTLIAEIDRYLSGELEAFSWEDEEPQEAPAPAAAPAPAPVADRQQLPIAGYDDLNVADIRPMLTDLSDAELRQVLEHEQARDNRKTIVNDIERRLDSGPAEPAPKAASRSTAKRATKTRKATKKATKRAAKKATKKAAASRFPIANYDELNVADIRPRLTKLTDAQLRQVREREAAGAGRKTILNDIDSRLS